MEIAPRENDICPFARIRFSRKSLRGSTKAHLSSLDSRAKGHTRDRRTEQNSLSQRAENGRGSECRSRCREIETRTSEEERRAVSAGREKEKSAERNGIPAK